MTYDTYPKEQYGRLPSLDPTLSNPTVGGHPGAVTYEATCKCSFARNYPYAFQGSRVGLAYQFLEKTVLRMGFGLAYDGTATAATGATNASPNNAFSAPGFGAPSMTLGGGVPASYVIPWPNLSSGAYPNPNFPASLNGPSVVVNQNAGRPARQAQWSVGIQREIIPNLVVDVAYVGNRGAWWLSSTLDNYNALTPQLLAADGLDINNSADRAILESHDWFHRRRPLPEQAPLPGVPRHGYRGPGTASVSAPGSPAGSDSSVWAPQGRTWYDSLQMKVTKRYLAWPGRGLRAFTWS